MVQLCLPLTSAWLPAAVLQALTITTTTTTGPPTLIVTTVRPRGAAITVPCHGCTDTTTTNSSTRVPIGHACPYVPSWLRKAHSLLLVLLQGVLQGVLVLVVPSHASATCGPLLVLLLLMMMVPRAAHHHH